MIVYPTAAELRQRRPRQKGVPADRLARRFVIETNGCWRWTGGLTTSGYGHISINSVYYQAHRFVYSVLRGPVTTTVMDHLCRNRWCVNPDHVEPVTAAVNAQRGNRSALTTDQVSTIRARRAAGAGVRALAREYGVNHACISRIVNGLTWKVSETRKEAAA